MQIPQRKRSQKRDTGEHLELPEKKCFLSLKQDGRVALDHVHEKIGESPGSDKDFGTSGSKKSRFVSEIWPFVGIAVRLNST